MVESQRERVRKKIILMANSVRVWLGDKALPGRNKLCPSNPDTYFIHDHDTEDVISNYHSPALFRGISPLGNQV